MGKAYRARDTKLSRDVALKIPPDALQMIPIGSRGYAGSLVLASVNQPHIAHIYGLDRQDGRDLTKRSPV